MSALRAVVAIQDLRDNSYFSAKAADLFAETVYLSSRPNSEQLKEALDDFDVVIIGAREKVAGDMISGDTRARIVGTLSIGTDHLDLNALKQNNIQVITSPTANVRSVAEHNVALTFALAKRLKEGDASILRGEGRGGLTGSVFELRGKTVGLIGYGKIGKMTAQIFSALGTDVIATSRSRTEGSDEVVRFVSLDTLLEAARIVVLAVPLTDETEGLLDSAALDRMQAGALLVNCCRPAMVDNDHVRELLTSGRLGGFGADYDEDVAGLAALPASVITPHIAGLTAEASDRLDNELIDGIEQSLADAAP